jgi:alpha-ketoglutarate-dependent taurine dioxygenase
MPFSRLSKHRQPVEDTLWASGYSLYDQLSPSSKAYLETLTGTYSQPGFKQRAEGKYEFYSGQRGAPENIGDELTAVHPIVRSNPVTGWKSIFAIGHHFTKFNELTDDESKFFKNYLDNLLVASHDIHVRFHWGKNDIAVWDNRSVYHSATKDYLNNFDRTGVRTVGIGERPYLFDNAKSRADGLNDKGLLV